MELVVDKMVTAKHGYVSTKELFDALCEEPQWSFTPNEVMMVVARLNITPTVDAEPIRHGKWLAVDKDLSVYQCSKCGDIRQIDDIPIFDFCPRCGARMDGE